MNNTTPIWLEMKPSFIDENFDKVVDYLEKNDDKQDAFYQETLRLLKERIEIALQAALERPLHDDDCLVEEGRVQDEQDKTGTHWRNARMYAAFLLTARPDDELIRSASAALLGEMMQISQTKDRMLGKQLDLLTRDCNERLPLSWPLIRKSADPMDFALRMQAAVSTGKAPKEGAEWTGCGYMLASAGNIVIASSQGELKSARVSNTEEMFSTLGKRVRVICEKSRKLSKSALLDFDKVDEWMEDTIRRMHQPAPVRTARKPPFEINQLTEVQITEVGKNISYRTLDPGHETLTGELWIEEENQRLQDYYPDDFCKALRKGDVMDVRILNPTTGKASILQPLEEMLLSKARRYKDAGEQFYGKALQVYTGNDGKQKVRWLTEEGLIIHTFNTEGVSESAHAYISLTKQKASVLFGTIEEWLPIEDLAEENKLDEQKIVADAITECVKRNEPLPATAEPDFRPFTAAEVKTLAYSLLQYQRSLTSVQERYMVLCIIRQLLEMIGSEEDKQYVSFLMGYLKNLMRFASGEKVEPVEAAEDAPLLIKRRQLILEVLSHLGEEDSQELSEIARAEESALLRRLCKLVQAYNNLDGVDSGNVRRFIHDEIVHSLSMQTEQAADLVINQRENLGQENAITEFKTSFCIDEQSMEVNEKAQNYRIMRAICAFLNSEAGGTIYMGVNDLGDVVGLANDYKYYKVYESDTYIRIIQDTIYRFFPNEYTCVSFPQEHTDKNSYLMIRVDAYRHGVARLEGIAYERWGHETRKMSDARERELLGQRLNTDKRKVNNLQALQDALQLKRQVELKKYYSAQSGRTEDRLVEAFCLVANNTSVLAYELSTGKVKNFKLARMSSVKLTETPWQHEDQHKKPKVDIFNMTETAEQPCFRVKLLLRMRACNLLMEEYPLSKEYIHETSDGKNEQWIFEAEMCSPKGVGRFVIGLRSEIDILEGEPLKAYIGEYVKQYLLEDTK